MIVAALLAAASLLPASPLPASPLTGAWRLESMDAILADSGRVVPNEAVDDAAHASGIIIYDASGWMALEIGAGGRPPPDRLGPVGRQRPIQTGSYYAYYGRYEIEPGKQIVRHLIADSLMPPEIGITAVRHYSIEGDRLTLTSDAVRRADGWRVNRITFRRLAGPIPTKTTTGQN